MKFSLDKMLLIDCLQLFTECPEGASETFDPEIGFWCTCLQGYVGDPYVKCVCKFTFHMFISTLF